MKEKQPKWGVWIKKEFQQRGYAYKALSNVMKMADESFQKEWYVYEADICNEGSMELIEKFDYHREIYNGNRKRTETTEVCHKVKVIGPFGRAVEKL